MVATAAMCGDARTLKGCLVEEDSGDWADGSTLNYGGDLACPIQIRQVHERVRRTPTILDRSSKYSRTEYAVYNSTDDIVMDTREAYPRMHDDGELFVMPVDYESVTGHDQIGDVDHIDFNSYKDAGGALSVLGLELKTEADRGLFNSLAGDELPLSNSSRTYLTDSRGAGTPHEYQWYRNGAWIGSGTSVVVNTGSGDFTLRVDARDQYGRVSSSSKAVDVDGVRAAISGPSLVYASSGGGEWTVSGRGGYEPYTFQWYLDGYPAGESPAFGGYTGEGGHTLRVDMRDSRGGTHSTSFSVTGIGNEQCEPVPPAIAC
jgi:hypothetical protein